MGWRPPLFVAHGPHARRALARGERFGMIRFGSRTDLLVPLEHLARLDVKTGQTVRAGKTVIGALR